MEIKTCRFWEGKRNLIKHLMTLDVWDPTSVEEENETFFIRVWKSLPNFEGKPKQESPKRTISVSGGLVLARRLSLEEGWTQGSVPTRTLGSEGGWIVRFHISWGEEWSILYKGVETSPSQTRLKTLRGSPKGKAQRGQYLLAVSLGCYINHPSWINFST